MIFPTSPGSSRPNQQLAVVFVGATGVGKSLAAKLIESADETFRAFPQHLTRRARSNELDGFDGYFVSDEMFERLELDGEFVVALRDVVSGARVGVARPPLEQFANRGVSPILAARNLRDARALTQALDGMGYAACVVYVYMREEPRKAALVTAGAEDEFFRELSLDRESKLWDLNACYEGSDLFIVNEGTLDAFRAQILTVLDYCRSKRAVGHGRMPTGLDEEALRAIEDDWRDLQRWSRGSRERSRAIRVGR
jgi:guanylate kinase